MNSVLALEQPSGFSSSIWQLVLASGPIAKAVLVILLAFSVLSWAIIFRKAFTFRRLEKQSQDFIRVFRRSSRLSEVQALCENFRDSPLASVFLAGFAELTQQIKTAAKAHNPGSSNPSDDVGTIKSIRNVQRALERAAAAELTTLESALNWLATTGSITPFVGLFGTVVGIINAFRGLGVERATTVQAVAPGIAEALVTTAAGLFAAIPAVIAYNHFVNRLRVIAAEIDDFSMEFLNLVERNFT